METNQTFTEHLNDIGYTIKILNDELEKRANEDLQKSGLTLSQMRVMAFIAQNNFQTTQKEIESHLGVSHPTVNGLLKRLESKGVITTELSVNRRLTKIVRMTEKGKDECEKAGDSRARHEYLLGKNLTAEERETLMELLNKVLNGITSA